MRQYISGFFGCMAFLALALSLSSCGSESNPNGEPNTETIDITNEIFTEIAADCEAYAESYSSAIRDIQNSTNFEGSVDIEDNSSGCTLTVNGIPNHDFNDQSAHFASNVAEVDRVFTISGSPQLAVESTPLSQQYYDGLMLNGVVIDMLSAGCYKPNDPMSDQDGNVAIGCNTSDNWLMDPLGTESKFGADTHNAHPQPDGTYHYHGNPMAMFDDNPGSEGSPVIGFAADGFPIFGSYFLDSETNEIRKAVSGYELKEGQRPGRDSNDPGGNYDGTYVDDYEFTGNGDLDECNGMTVKGQYGYYVTDTYPWIMACHSGTVDGSFSKGMPKAKLDHSH